MTASTPVTNLFVEPKKWGPHDGAKKGFERPRYVSLLITMWTSRRIGNLILNSICRVGMTKSPTRLSKSKPYTKIALTFGPLIDYSLLWYMEHAKIAGQMTKFGRRSKYISTYLGLRWTELLDDRMWLIYKNTNFAFFSEYIFLHPNCFKV